MHDTFIRSLNENDSTDRTCQILLDETSQFSEGSANVSVTRFAERSENSEVF